jgi:hypothetical protein
MTLVLQAGCRIHDRRVHDEHALLLTFDSSLHAIWPKRGICVIIFQFCSSQKRAFPQGRLSKLPDLDKYLYHRLHDRALVAGKVYRTVANREDRPREGIMATATPCLTRKLVRAWPNRYARLTDQRRAPPNPRWAFFVNGAPSGPERTRAASVVVGER